MEYFLSIAFFITVIILIVYICQNKKIKKEKEQFQNELNLVVEDKSKILAKELSKLYQQKETLEKEIREKNNFNESLLKLREEELNRLIEKERQEKRKNLDSELLIYKEHQLLNISTDIGIRKAELQSELFKKQNELLELDDILEDYRTRRESINKAILREKEIQEQEAFYKIDIPKNVQEDIQVLEQIRPQLKNREALSKLIWDVFIQRPVSELTKRITNGRDISGIYKITYVKTGEAYIGKTTNIKTRFINHCKTVCGLEGAAHSTLHTHMEKNGMWNYTFEIIEEVEKDKLGEKEAYYIDFYDTKNYGLNQKRGG